MVKRLTTALAALAFAATAQATETTGAGSTFVYPIIAKWAADYQAKTGNKVNYQSIGSGGGLAQIKSATVDFGASDMPMKTSFPIGFWAAWSAIPRMIPVISD